MSTSKAHIFPLCKTASTAFLDVPISSRVTKWYSLPFSSPGLGLRVVCETLKANASGNSFINRFNKVDLPLPDGPQNTTGLKLLPLADCDAIVRKFSSILLGRYQRSSENLEE
ncbi:hypothetical protein BpHYR1_022483 [Brachionus plicatilis]|uniref:Uncharacterized protein n=1 Tax=Brachionus plicatilis TaxID=10195 RepID=A0A3M7Q0T7_BRAPC|nr:hypothetical protein BpHYR1_022483 [Brachionus plicatilis]